MRNALSTDTPIDDLELLYR